MLKIRMVVRDDDHDDDGNDDGHDDDDDRRNMLDGKRLVSGVPSLIGLRRPRPFCEGSVPARRPARISFALSVTQALNWSVRMASQLEAEMVAGRADRLPRSKVGVGVGVGVGVWGLGFG